MYNLMSRVSVMSLQELADLVDNMQTVQMLCDEGFEPMPAEQYPQFRREKEIAEAELFRRSELLGMTNHKTPEL